MHLHFERNTNAKCDCSILSLTWMGKVPDELPEDEGWKLNRTNYYQEGWLATGNVRGIVGVTFTTSHCKKSVDVPLRTNYNLRGHRSEVILVKWNEPYQKLASCDSSGIIFVWIKYEGRWSIELINDRNTPVTHFSWSHDGRMALICYQDGFVLVGSVAGQRYWSSMLTLKSTITCGIWTPDDQQVYFGTSSGQIIVMDVHGAMVSQVQLTTDAAITGMAWSAEKFKMEETDENDPNSSAHAEDRVFVLAVSFHNGYIFLMKSFDDVSPIQVHTGLIGPLFLEWSNSRELLAVAGTISSPVPSEHRNVLKFYSDSGVLLYCTLLPYTQSPVTALTWGHNDKRLFIATGCQVHVAWVSRRVASLQLMCRLRVHAQLRTESQLKELPLPPRIKGLISNLFAQTIRCCVPSCQALREFVSRPPQGSARLHCTMIRHGDHETSNGNAGVNGSLVGTGTCYTLYLEYLGGLVPLLKGKRISKIRPEFVIFDPQVDDSTFESGDSNGTSNYPSGSNAERMSGGGSSSDTDIEDGCASPRVQRRRRRRRHRRAKSNGSTTNGQVITNNFNFAGESSTATTSGLPHPLSSIFGGPEAEPEDLTYLDTLPEDVRLVEVTSNIWGTKFKIHGLASSVPANLGQVTYKTSLLHLQPRQMTLVMTELRDDIAPGPDPNFHPNLFSEDEEEINQVTVSQDLSILSEEQGIPIAPMTPRPPSVPRFQRQIPSPLAAATGSTSERLPRPPSLVKAESYEEKSFDLVNFCETLRDSQTSSNNNGARSKLVCEGAVPTLQSPKNSVAPSEVMLEGSTSLTVNATERSKLSLTLNLEPHELRPLMVKRQEERRKLKASPGSQSTQGGKWMVKTTDDMLYIDEDNCTATTAQYLQDSSVRRSCSVGYLDLVDVHLVLNDIALHMRGKEQPKRLVLVNCTRRNRKNKNKAPSTGPKLKHCGKSRSLDSSDLIADSSASNSNNKNEPSRELPLSSLGMVCDLASQPWCSQRSSGTRKSPIRPAPPCTPSPSTATCSKFFFRKRDESSPDQVEKKRDSRCSTPRLPRSSPASPAPTKKPAKRNQSSSPIRKHILNSPLLNRRLRKAKQTAESSDDEVVYSGDEVFNGKNYRDLESFQKAQLRQKLKRNKFCESLGVAGLSTPRRREFVMHNKAPMWNENSQVYQLDFGGRVTQESAKNFQIEFRNKQVMQFGRIDGNAYTLDFQYPFSALQAFAVALANVTQRLK